MDFKLKPKTISELFKARLSRRIVLLVFLSIVVVEAVLLIPSVYRREQEQLQNIQKFTISMTFGTIAQPEIGGDPKALFRQLQAIEKNPKVLGGILYQSNGTQIGEFGEIPELSFEQITKEPNASKYNRTKQEYSAAWPQDLLGDKYTFIVQYDAHGIQQEIYAFVGRIAVLVLIISVFVTLSTMILLHYILITPILQLRNDLLKAGDIALQDPEHKQMGSRFESLASHRQDELGEVINAFGEMHHQITESLSKRKAATLALKESEERFRTLIEHAVDAFLVVDAQGRFIDVNQQACKNLGYLREELLQLSVPDIQKALTIEDFRTLWHKLTSGKSITVDGEHQRKDGTTIPVEVRLGLFELGGQQLILALARDITERKQAETAMARLAEIGELAAMIVHEIRNPLTTVLMGLNYFKRQDLSAGAEMRLQLALEESERLERLLNEILLYAKKQRLNLLQLNLTEFIEEILAPIQSMPAALDRQIQFNSSSNNIYIQGDRDKLRQVFINLVCNACEAIPPDQVVTWEIQSAMQPVGRVYIRINNGGDPIPPEVLPQLTQPFFTTKSSGNGLGLAITKRIVEAHDGTFTIESSAEAGTTVTLDLPIVL